MIRVIEEEKFNTDKLKLLELLDEYVEDYESGMVYKYDKQALLSLLKYDNGRTIKEIELYKNALDNKDDVIIISDYRQLVICLYNYLSSKYYSDKERYSEDGALYDLFNISNVGNILYKWEDGYKSFIMNSSTLYNLIELLNDEEFSY